VAEVEQESVRRVAEGTTELSQVFADLVQEQTRQNIEALTALSRAVDWERILQVQGEFLRASLERTALFTRRYFEVSQAVMTSAASAAQRRKAA
jgi:hypothetical protein